MMDLKKEFETIRLLGILPDDVPLQEIIPLADSLLAAPVLAVAVQTRTANGRQLILDLRRRAAGQMLVGAWLEDAFAEPTAEAEFVIFPTQSPQKFLAIDPQTLQPVAELVGHQDQPAASVARYVWMDTPDEMFDLGSTYSGTVGIAAKLWLDEYQTMAETITLARQYRALLYEQGG